MTAIALRLPPRLETSSSAPALLIHPPQTATSLESPKLLAAKSFLRTLTDEEHTTAAIANNAATLLSEIFNVAPDLDPPRIAPGFDGLVGMTWQNDAYHLNVEVFSDGRVEFFFEDLKSGELWEDEMAKVERPSLAATVRLRRLAL